MIAALAFTVALAALAVGSVRWSRVLAAPLGLDAYGRAALAAAIGISAFLVPVALVGRLFHSFDVGLAAAAVAAGVLAALSFRVRAPVAAPQRLERRVAFFCSLA